MTTQKEASILINNQAYLIPCRSGARAKGGRGISMSWEAALIESGSPDLFILFAEPSLEEPSNN